MNPLNQPLTTNTQSLKIGVLSNPNSGRNRNDMRPIREILTQHPRVLHREAQAPGEIAMALQDFARRDLDMLVINGGDGTVQAVLTVLFQRRAFARPPLLGLLCGGTTNMTAGDVGIRGNRKKALIRLLAWATTRHPQAQILQRPVLRVQAPGQDPLYGMFFGTGAIIKGIEYCHQKIHAQGLRGGLASGLCTLRVLLAMIRGDPEYVSPVPATIGMDPSHVLPQGLPQKQDLWLLLASTLERLFLGLRPYWGEEAGALYYTAIRAHPAHALRAMPPLLWGHSNKFGTPENGYFSHKVNALRLVVDSAFTLDGEIYQAESRTGPLLVGQAGPASFIRL
jgi:diacylglycerol kinase (ATP)